MFEIGEIGTVLIKCIVAASEAEECEAAYDDDTFIEKTITQILD